MSTRVSQANPLHFLTLNNVLLVPGCPFTLLLISHLAKSLNCLLSFFSDFCVIQDLRMGKDDDEGHESDGFYYLNSHRSSTICSISDSSDLIYRGLEHPSLSKLQKIVPILPKLSNLD